MTLKRSAWTEERVARELEAWFAQRAFEQWPTYNTFRRAGRKRLYAELTRYGGPQRWAVELGVPFIRHPPGARRSHDQIRAELRALLREHRPQRFPSGRWIEQHGPPGLAASVTRTGGGGHWAVLLNMPPPKPARWTDDRIEAELRRVCATYGRWPTKAEFEAVHARRLLRAVYAGHGSAWWAQRLGVPAKRLQRRRGLSRQEPKVASGQPKS